MPVNFAFCQKKTYALHWPFMVRKWIAMAKKNYANYAVSNLKVWSAGLLWSENGLPWLKELLWQSILNFG